MNVLTRLFFDGKAIPWPSVLKKKHTGDIMQHAVNGRDAPVAAISVSSSDYTFIYIQSIIFKQMHFTKQTIKQVHLKEAKKSTHTQTTLIDFFFQLSNSPLRRWDRERVDWKAIFQIIIVSGTTTSDFLFFFFSFDLCIFPDVSGKKSIEASQVNVLWSCLK